MVLTDPKDVNPDFVSENRLVDDVANNLRVCQRAAIGSRRDIAE
jgi:hypothetical protein